MSEEVRNWKSTRLAFSVNGTLVPIVAVSWGADIPVTIIDTMQSSRAGVFTGPIGFRISATILQIGTEAKDITHFALGKEFIDLLLAVKEGDEWSYDDISWSSVMVTGINATGHMPGERPVIALTMIALRYREGDVEYGEF